MSAHTNTSAPVPSDLILWDVVSEHYDEAMFHFELWERSLFSPELVLDQVRGGFEARLEQHIAGFLTAGEPGAERLLHPELEEMTSPSQTTLATLLMLRLSQRTVHYELLDYLFSSHDSAQRRAIVRGAGLYDDPRFEVVLREAFARARSPKEKAMLLEVFAALHLDPGEMLDDCFDTGFAALDLAAVKTIGRCCRLDLASKAFGFLDTDDQELRRVAIEAGLFLGSKAAWSGICELAASKDALAPWAMCIVAMLGGVGDHERVLHARLDDESMRQAALWAMGLTGRVQSAELCLRYLEDDDERTAKLAAEAFGEITGLSRLTLKFFTAESSNAGSIDVETDDAPVPLEDDDLDANLVPDGTDELLLLDPFRVAAWYEKNRHRFTTKKRYLAGKERDPDAIIEALITFPMRRRHEVAFELALRTGAQRWVTTDAFTPRQVRELRGLADLEESDLSNRFDSE